jgi:hypothetical protein
MVRRDTAFYSGMVFASGSAHMIQCLCFAGEEDLSRDGLGQF